MNLLRSERTDIFKRFEENLIGCQPIQRLLVGMRVDVYAVAEAKRLAFGHPPTLPELATSIQFVLTKGVGDKEAGVDSMPPRLAEVFGSDMSMSPAYFSSMGPL